MKVENIKKLLDSCFVAKRITELMETLPKGLKPRHIHVIDCIFTLSQKKDTVCVSEVSQQLHITTPSVTKLIHELEEKKVLEKYSLKEDKRVTLLRLTPLGLEYEDRYVTKYHAKWAENLSDLSDEEAELVVAVITKLKEAMPKGGYYES